MPQAEADATSASRECTVRGQPKTTTPHKQAAETAATATATTTTTTTKNTNTSNGSIEQARHQPTQAIKQLSNETTKQASNQPHLRCHFGSIGSYDEQSDQAVPPPSKLASSNRGDGRAQSRGARPVRGVHAAWPQPERHQRRLYPMRVRRREGQDSVGTSRRRPAQGHQMLRLRKLEEVAARGGVHPPCPSRSRDQETIVQ